MPKPPFRPKVAGSIGFWFGVVAGAVVSVISLRRMGYTQKAKKVIWITVLATLVFMAIVLLIPDAPGRLLGFVLEVVWYVIFPKIQDHEFAHWEATHRDVSPSSGWGAIGWGLLGLIMLFSIGVAASVLLVATGIIPP